MLDFVRVVGFDLPLFFEFGGKDKRFVLFLLYFVDEKLFLKGIVTILVLICRLLQGSTFLLAFIELINVCFEKAQES